jgi:hypothetical protein
MPGDGRFSRWQANLVGARLTPISPPYRESLRPRWNEKVTVWVTPRLPARGKALQQG